MHSVPLFPTDNRLMAVFDDLPFITRDFVDGITFEEKARKKGGSVVK